MPTCYLACPAYAAADVHQATSTAARAAAICAELGWELVPSPLLATPRGIGTWWDLPQRLQDWAQACTHDAIWAFRGGHGALELAVGLAAGPGGSGAAGPSQLIGYSDITALHLLWQQQNQPGAIYAPIAAQSLEARSRSSLLRALRGQAQTWDGSISAQARGLRSGRASGPACAACLRLLAASCGTALQPDLRGRLLLIEDIDERPYAVDRDLHQLAAAGVLDGVLGLVGNSFPHEAPPDYAGPDHAAILRAWADRLAVPAMIGLPFGHDPDPLSIAQGRELELVVDGADWRLVQR
jgi:muramoyltetrapeptide carboxypeptidase